MKAICLSNMASVSTESGVQFAPYSSAVDAAFWHRLTQNKLEIYQLDDKPQPLQGYYVNSEYGSIREWVIKHNFGKIKQTHFSVNFEIKTHCL